MEYTIDHKTTYAYHDSVDQSYTIVHLQPRSDPNQYCTRYVLELAPQARVFSYADRFGNDVQHFAIMPRHKELSITAHSNVVTLLPAEPPVPDDATRGSLDEDARLPEYYDYLHESEYIHFTPELDRFRRELEAPGPRIGSWCHYVSQYLHEHFAYDQEATTVRTIVDEALMARGGVCQDYAHIMIAVLRSAGIPARYVSGYIFRGESNVLGAEASHAWCEAYLPPYGWTGFDPTNDRIVNDHFVKIAFGRDYRDVSPVRGIYRGSKGSEMNVNVAMDILAHPQ